MAAGIMGRLAFCGREMTRGGWRAICQTAPTPGGEAEAEKTRRQRQTLYHLQIQDAYSGYFWLHLEMRGGATLEDLDRYLRAIWLECCGHLSEFTSGHGATRRWKAAGWNPRIAP